MSGFPIIDLVIGLIFIYFLLSIINNSLIELVASATRLKAFYLKLWLRETFSNVIRNGQYKGQTFYNVIINHAILNNLSEKNNSTNYISPSDFSTAVIEIITSDQHQIPDNILNIETSVRGTTIVDDSIKSIFLMYCANARQIANKPGSDVTEIDSFKAQIEGWFKNAMDRVSGVFRKKTLLFTVIFATFISIGLNIDSVVLMKYLYSNPQARQQLAANAAKTGSNPAFAVKYKNKTNSPLADTLLSMTYTLDSLKTDYINKQADILSAYSDINALSLPIGWNANEYKIFLHQNNYPDDRNARAKFVLSKFIGFLITILAMCLGAPFWFGLLSQIADVRSSIKPA